MANVPNGQSCEKCRYFREYSRSAESGDGICARFPPTMSAGNTQFPQTFKRSWCGEYVPANPETISEGAATMARLVQIGGMAAARALADYLKEGGS